MTSESLLELDITVVLVIVAIYVLGVVPQFLENVSNLFDRNDVKLLFVLLIVVSGYVDYTVGTCVGIAFIVTFFASRYHKSLSDMSRKVINNW